MKKMFCLILFLSVSGVYAQEADSSIGTKEDRKALFNYIIDRSRSRDAISHIKNKQFGFDPVESMMKLENEFVNAASAEAFWYALQKLSAARRDSHLSVDEVKNGVPKPVVKKGQAPVRFHPDFSDSSKAFLFVSDIAKDLSVHVKGKELPQIGDRLISVNGINAQQYMDSMRLYDGYSSTNNFLMRCAFQLSERSEKLPGSFYRDELELVLERKSGRRYAVSLPYLQQVSWTYGRELRDYPGYQLAWKKESFWVYTPIDPANKSLLLWWYGFRSDLQVASDSLVSFAEKNGFIDYDLIIDAIDSRGGSQGAYSLARLTSQSFKTTGGNLKISDITSEFINKNVSEYLSGKRRMDGSEAESENDGWLIDWLTNDVVNAAKAGQEYSNNTPFKNAHLPAYSDWIMRPAPKHMRGRLVVFFGPWGGSHLDQFSAMIYDNGIGYTMGMPCGGYSNTWEWSEMLVFPISRKPVVEFMWNIGHTIRPNGQVLEGNPAPVNLYFPVTRDNYLNYRKILLEKARQWLSIKRDN